MDIDTAASPAGAADTQVVHTAAPANAAPEAQTQAEGTTEGTTATTTEEIDPLDGLLAPDIDEVEVEYEGIKAKVPAPLKDALLRQQDYTQKTMALADERRQVEAERRSIHEAQQLNAAEIKALADFHAIGDQLAEFQDIDWTVLDHSNPEVQNAKGVRDELIRKHQLKQAQLNEHFAIKARNAQQSAAKEREAVDAEMTRVVKDWSPEKRGQFEKFMISHGVPAEIVGKTSAVEMKLVRLAMIGAQAETQRLAAIKAANAAKTQPAPEVGAAGTGTSDPSGMSMEQYKAWRASQKD